MFYVIVISAIFLVFRNWFNFLTISSGDLSFFFREQIIQYMNLPFMWETFRNSGFGGTSFVFQGVYLYNIPLGILGNYFDYGVVERIIWFFPILLIGFVAPIILGRTLKLFDSKFYPLISFIFILNTYFLIIMGGGQLTVALGYITIPLALALFLDVMNNTKLFKIIIFSFVFSFLVFFDFRFTYIFLVILFIYTTLSFVLNASLSNILMIGKKYFIVFLFTFVITLSSQAYWMLPFSMNYKNPVASVKKVFTADEAVRYFSFAEFENSLSLLHPLWPENIFGKVGFMKPEFLLMSILAFSSLLFISSKFKVLASRRSGQSSKLQSKVQNYRNNITIEQFNNRTIVFFALLGLVGMFLAKGTKEPFGDTYLWLFKHVPGFVMFRDATKWYTLTALSYSILIPYSIYKIFELLRYHWEKSKITHSASSGQKSKIQFKIQKYLPNLFLILTISYLLFIIRPAILGDFGGTLKNVEVPKEYIELKNFLVNQNNFFRVLWVPVSQRFTYYSDIHPIISGNEFFDVSEPYGVIATLQKKDIKEQLQKSGVKYVIVPDDTQKEIFIKDRKFDLVQYNETLKRIKKVPYLKEINRFGNIIIFEIDNPKDHFWSSYDNLKVTYKFINPTEYNVQVENAKKTNQIIFTESFDKNWVAKIDNNLINSEPFDKKFNSFILPKDGNYEFKVYYKAQELVKIGLAISVLSFSFILLLMIFLGIRGKMWLSSSRRWGSN